MFRQLLYPCDPSRVRAAKRMVVGRRVLRLHSEQHPGTPRYTVIPISHLNQYRNILCKVRYSTEAAANAAAIAAEAGNDELTPWEVVWWPPKYRSEHPETSRFEAVPQTDIRKFWSLGARTEWSGMSRPDATHEAARRSGLPELWCVFANDGARFKGQEPHTVKSFDGLSHSEKDKVRATYDSERAAWQAIPLIAEREREQTAKYEQQRREWENTEQRKEGIREVLRLAAVVCLLVGSIWLIITVVRWFWLHPLF